MSLWSKLRGLVGSPDGRGLLAGAGGCCCGPGCECDPTRCISESEDNGLGSGTFAPETSFPFPYYYDWKPVWAGGAPQSGFRCCNPSASAVAYRLKYKIEITWLVGGCAGGRAWYIEVEENYDGRVSPLATYTLKRTSTSGGNQGWMTCNAPIVTTQGTFDGSMSCGFGLRHPFFGQPDYHVGVVPFAPIGFQFAVAPLPSVRQIDASFGNGLDTATPANMTGSFYNGLYTTYGSINYTLNRADGVPVRRVVASWEGNIVPACSAPSCTIPCCMPDGHCRETASVTECLGIGGISGTVGVPCFDTNCTDGTQETGACCDPATGYCVISTPLGCTAPRVFRGLGTNCVSNPCPQPTAACCLNGNCTMATQVGCQTIGGTWHAGTNCNDPATCASPGACCLAGGCQDVGSAAACAALGGVFQGPGTLCVGSQCVGACCVPLVHGYACTQESLFNCQQLNGTWFPNTPCFPSPCPGGTGGRGSGGFL